ncbi:AbrB/MazE/SpoVT family DNA-binding domain-containing protein [Xanthobacter tagetidis]|jgi:antitoxin MazE|uniref:AbrB/MazE/SpoVT family DNA-binding domain-containing protein n=1 Tax=Xanthobacter tagetidis TaxID=60216 RepID=A0A3L7A6W4_9HYPH|nr:AbrB/MazE/SpoVT family DNA-binding domain-containing protein [Xanthobacter tagetidis]MBB6307267.1 antitoxin MazE [Xanthobacter tagetidis]RLP75815.1 AbrB/MazE/SpoVT family DNA-binding domain-containing protein [Xanthobacter tagetidis]
MKVKVAKWGNSVAVRIPKSVADDLGLRPGSVVELERDGSSVSIHAEPKVKIPRYRLEDLVAEMKRLGPENEPETVDWGPDVGSEIIDDEWSNPTGSRDGAPVRGKSDDASRRR